MMYLIRKMKWTSKAADFQPKWEKCFDANDNSEANVKYQKEPPHDDDNPRNAVVSQPRPAQVPTKAADTPREQLRCDHCLQLFNPESNPKGSCPYAPDESQQCIDYVSCICAARGMMYHCMADAEGEFMDPCSCNIRSDSHFCQHWFLLGLLSVVVPCLCCYLPLKCCHLCGTKCGCCGGRHKAGPPL